MLDSTYEILLTEKFITKVNHIKQYIFYELQNPIASYQFEEKLLQNVSKLYYLPEARLTYQNTKYHYFIMKHWLIFYEVHNHVIEIFEIFNSKQNIINRL